MLVSVVEQTQRSCIISFRFEKDRFHFLGEEEEEKKEEEKKEEKKKEKREKKKKNEKT